MMSLNLDTRSISFFLSLLQWTGVGWYELQGFQILRTSPFLRSGLFLFLFPLLFFKKRKSDPSWDSTSLFGYFPFFFMMITFSQWARVNGMYYYHGEGHSSLWVYLIRFIHRTRGWWLCVTWIGTLVGPLGWTITVKSRERERDKTRRIRDKTREFNSYLKVYYGYPQHSVQSKTPSNWIIPIPCLISISTHQYQHTAAMVKPNILRLLWHCIVMDNK